MSQGTEEGRTRYVVEWTMDIWADSAKHAAELASRLGTKVVMLDGAHFIPRECSEEVSDSPQSHP